MSRGASARQAQLSRSSDENFHFRTEVIRERARLSTNLHACMYVLVVGSVVRLCTHIAVRSMKYVNRSYIHMYACFHNYLDLLLTFQFLRRLKTDRHNFFA